MEITGAVNMVYILWALAPHHRLAALPLPNLLVAALYLLHYANRAVVSPFFAAPSMSPIHALVVVLAMVFNWLNSACLAAWLAGYTTPVVIGRSSDPLHLVPSAYHNKLVNSLPPAAAPAVAAADAWPATVLPWLGLVLFFAGMLGNIFSERSLFRLRRQEAERRAAKKRADEPTRAVVNYHKVYVIPPCEGVFRSILYPHYVFEWLEWLGFALVGTAVWPTAAAAHATPAPVTLAPWLVPAALLVEAVGSGSGSRIPLPLPALVFFVNAVMNMLPMARRGRKWYLERFGAKAVAGRGAVVPWCPAL